MNNEWENVVVMVVVIDIQHITVLWCRIDMVKYGVRWRMVVIVKVQCGGGSGSGLLKILTVI